VSVHSSSTGSSAARRKKAENARRQNLPSRRTTVTLSPESREIVDRFKCANGISTSAAVDQIIQRSEPTHSRLVDVNGFLVLSVPSDRQDDSRRVTLDDIRRAEDEMDREYAERILHRERKPAPTNRRAGTRP